MSDLTLVRVYEELQGLGYRGGYDAVRRYATAWQRERSAVTAAAHVPLSFAPGEAYQFDWSHEIVVIAGATTTVKVAHIRASIRRFLLHVLPKGFHRIRHYGLLAGATRKARLDHVRQLLGVAPPATADEQVEPDDIRPPCPCCGGHMVVIETFERQRQPRAPPLPALPPGIHAP